MQEQLPALDAASAPRYTASMNLNKAELVAHLDKIITAENVRAAEAADSRSSRGVNELDKHVFQRIHVCIAAAFEELREYISPTHQ